MVSIITPSFNKEKYISETINSVINQSYANLELIIVDDCSTDGTIDIVKSFAKYDQRIQLFSNLENKGANFCRNEGIHKAKGDYIIFLDADDVLDRDCLLKRIAFMSENDTLDFSVHTLLVFEKTIGDSSFKWMPASKKPLIQFLSHNLPWQTMQPIWKRKFLLELQGFDESFQRMQDVELHTRALLVPNVNFKLIVSEPDCYFRIDEARKNFTAKNFLTRWVDSALKYCDKFKNNVPKKLSKYLLGTIYQTYLQVLHHFKLKQISKNEFESLEQQLMRCQLVAELGFSKRKIFKFSKIYNLYFFRIPGMNQILKWIIIYA